MLEKRRVRPPVGCASTLHSNPAAAPQERFRRRALGRAAGAPGTAQVRGSAARAGGCQGRCHAAAALHGEPWRGCLRPPAAPPALKLASAAAGDAQGGGYLSSYQQRKQQQQQQRGQQPGGLGLSYGMEPAKKVRCCCRGLAALLCSLAARRRGRTWPAGARIYPQGRMELTWSAPRLLAGQQPQPEGPAMMGARCWGRGQGERGQCDEGHVCNLTSGQAETPRSPATRAARAPQRRACRP
jgi:hypothetical protein